MELFDRLLIVNEHHLRRVLTEYLLHYNTARPHRALGQLKLTPGRRRSTSLSTGSVKNESSADSRTSTRSPPDSLTLLHEESRSPPRSCIRAPHRRSCQLRPPQPDDPIAGPSQEPIRRRRLVLGGLIKEYEQAGVNGLEEILSGGRVISWLAVTGYFLVAASSWVQALVKGCGRILAPHKDTHAQTPTPAAKALPSQPTRLWAPEWPVGSRWPISPRRLICWRTSSTGRAPRSITGQGRRSRRRRWPARPSGR